MFFSSYLLICICPHRIPQTRFKLNGSRFCILLHPQPVSGLLLVLAAIVVCCIVYVFVYVCVCCLVFRSQFGRVVVRFVLTFDRTFNCLQISRLASPRNVTLRVPDQLPTPYPPPGRSTGTKGATCKGSNPGTSVTAAPN